MCLCRRPEWVRSLGARSSEPVLAAGPASGWASDPDSGADAPLFASDADRDAISDLLRRHLTDGRISIDDFDARLGEVWQSHTRAELRHALRDLPPLASPLVADERPAPAGHRVCGWLGAAAVRTYVTVMAMLVLIYALTSPGRYFWPIWPMVFWGIPLWLGLRHRRRRWQ